MKHLLALLLFASIAHAETLRLITLEDILSPNPSDVQKIYLKASPYFKELGYTLRVKFLRVPPVCQEFHTRDSDDRKNELDCFYDLHPNPRRRVYTYYITPPWMVDGRSWMGGVTYICKNIATGTATPHSIPDDLPRIAQSAIILAHEFGHMKGAKHIPDSNDELYYYIKHDCNLMHPEGIRCSYERKLPLRVLHRTKRQVRLGFCPNT